MNVIAANLQQIRASLPAHVTLVAVSKTKPITDLSEAYDAGQRIFGENKIQEMTQKWEALPKDIEWHMIGHVQTNKVKYMAPYVHTIHAVDSLKLLKEINKQALKHDRIIHCFLQIKIAQEDSKFGMHSSEATTLINSEAVQALSNIRITGVMGMATFTEDTAQIQSEFDTLRQFFITLSEQHPSITELSIGMSGDYKIAIATGSTMVRIGSSIFGARNYQHS